MIKDIVIVGSTEEEHHLRLTKVCQRFAKRGLTVNEKKGKIRMTSTRDIFDQKMA